MFGIEWLTFVSLLGWFYYVDNLNKFTKKQILKDFYLGTFIVTGLSYCWLMQAEAQNWNVSLHGWFKAVAQIVSWLLVCLFVSIGGLVLGWVMTKLTKFKYKLLIFVLLLPLYEVVKSFLFAIISFGNGGSLVPNFFVGSLAVSVSGTPLIYASRLVGFMGLSLLSSLLVLATCLIFKKQYKYSLALFILVVVVVFAGYYFVDNQKQSKPLKTVVVHLDEADSLDQWADFNKIPDNIDLLVLPEYSGVLDSKHLEALTQKLNTNGMVVTTVAVGRSPEMTNRLTVFNKDRQIISQQDKDFLIPAGEYLPYSLIGAFKLLRQDNNIVNFRYTQQTKPGTKPIELIKHDNLAIGALACSGVISPAEYKRLTSDGADILTNSASLAFLKKNSRFNVFGKNMARYQAVSNYRPFVQASRSGESYMITPNGKFVTQNTSQDTQILSW